MAIGRLCVRSCSGPPGKAPKFHSSIEASKIAARRMVDAEPALGELVEAIQSAGSLDTLLKRKASAAAAPAPAPKAPTPPKKQPTAADGTPTPPAGDRKLQTPNPSSTIGKQANRVAFDGDEMVITLSPRRDGTVPKTFRFDVPRLKLIAQQECGTTNVCFPCLVMRNANRLEFCQSAGTPGHTSATSAAHAPRNAQRFHERAEDEALTRPSN